MTSNLSMASTNTPSLEARLSAIEAKLGVLPLANSSSLNAISSRLDTAKSTMDARTTSQFRDICLESEKLMKELDPGMALTHQSQPLLYRRQEILASSESLKRDMDELRNILHLLLTSQPAHTDHLREEQVTQAPIITAPSISHEDERRLDALRLLLLDITARSEKLVSSMDNMLECYHTVVTAASEKFVLADETISHSEARKI
jgi:hypothetical protein